MGWHADPHEIQIELADLRRGINADMSKLDHGWAQTQAALQARQELLREERKLELQALRLEREVTALRGAERRSARFVIVAAVLLSVLFGAQAVTMVLGLDGDWLVPGFIGTVVVSLTLQLLVLHLAEYMRDRRLREPSAVVSASSGSQRHIQLHIAGLSPAVESLIANDEQLRGLSEEQQEALRIASVQNDWGASEIGYLTVQLRTNAAAAAKLNLTSVADWVALREGDPSETLRDQRGDLAG